MAIDTLPVRGVRVSDLVAGLRSGSDVAIHTMPPLRAQIHADFTANVQSALFGSQSALFSSIQALANTIVAVDTARLFTPWLAQMNLTMQRLIPYAEEHAAALRGNFAPLAANIRWRTGWGTNISVKRALVLRARGRGLSLAAAKRQALECGLALALATREQPQRYRAGSRNDMLLAHPVIPAKDLPMLEQAGPRVWYFRWLFRRSIREAEADLAAEFPWLFDSRLHRTQQLEVDPPVTGEASSLWHLEELAGAGTVPSSSLWDIDAEALTGLACLGVLPPLRRRILGLRADGYSSKEIGDRLGMNRNTVRWHLAEAKKVFSPPK